MKCLQEDAADDFRNDFWLSELAQKDGEEAREQNDDACLDAKEHDGLVGVVPRCTNETQVRLLRTWKRL